MINKKSDELVILIATYNRLNLLKKTITSILNGTNVPFEVIVIDGGSTDGTCEYLKSNRNITFVLQNKLLGTARTYNRVWRKVVSKYSCWLSDDTEIIKGSLDEAVKILERKKDIGMVGLKMKDIIGHWQDRPYMGAISNYGILNCNHGVLPTVLAKKIGYFNEDYISYMIDPDLTASILCTGKKVVTTKKIAVLHHREWSKHKSTHEISNFIKTKMKGRDNLKIYLGKFKFLGANNKLVIYKNFIMETLVSSLTWRNILNGRFISKLDYWLYRDKPYHLVQQIPKHLLLSEDNPYRELIA